MAPAVAKAKQMTIQVLHSALGGEATRMQVDDTNRLPTDDTSIPFGLCGTR